MTPRATLLAGLAILASLASLAPARASEAWWDHGGANACYHCRLAAAAVSSRAFDEATGRDLRNYPRHRDADFLHMRLEIDIADMNTPRAEATQTLTFAPISRPLPRLTLDAPLLQIHATESPGYATTHTHADDGTLTISFDPPIPVGEQTQLTIRYTIDDPPEGLHWTPESPAWPGRPAQLHTQGQPESNRYWFPCHDFPNERLTTELIVHVPRGFVASSNGRLVSHTRSGARETYHWLQDKDHVSYLVTLVVGKFDIVDLGTRELPMPVYAPLGLGDRVRRTYGRTPEMIALFSRLIDEPYPWDRYAQLIVHNFVAGGMENTSATTMYDTAILSRDALPDGDLDGLIAHELAHQWFGDLITCRSWEHIWLNEGFATYFTNLWWEHRDGVDAYQAGVRGNFRSVIAADTGAAPDTPAMVSKQYDHPWDVFRRAANPYPKGASILHMLRMKLGDEAFFAGLALYVDRNRFNVAETGDLRRCLEEVSGLSLQRFFDQWCYRPGIPRLRVEFSWDSAASELVATVTQTQTINGPNPAFALDLPIWVTTAPPGDARARWQRFTLSTDARTATARFPLPAEPTIIAVDPEMHVLAELSINHDQPRWLAQLRAGPTFAARAQAAEALRDADVLTSEATDALLAVVRDTRATIQLRQAAIEALHPAAALHPLLADPPSDARLLRTLTERAGALAAADTPTSILNAIHTFLASASRPDRTGAVRAAALTALVRARHPDALAILERAASADSQHDQIRQAAASALAELNVPAALPIVAALTAPGHNSRTRAIATEALGRLAHHDPDAALKTLCDLLTDREPRTARAAGDALAAMGDERCRPHLDAYAAAARSAILKDQAARWLQTLTTKLAPAPH